MYSNICVVLVVCVYFGYARDLPSYVKPCSLSAPDFDDCCLQHAKEAIPTLVKGDKRYNIPNLNPLILPLIKLQSEETFKLELRDVHLYGLEQIDLKVMRFDIKNQKIYVRGYLDQLSIIGKYDVNGRILIVPIQGNGDINITAVGLEVEYDAKYTLDKTKGEEYIKLGEAKSDFKVKTGYFHLENLFNGNKELGESTNKLLNEEPVKFVDAIKPVITETITKVSNSIVSAVASVVPYKKIFLE